MRLWVALAVVVAGCGPTASPVPRVDAAAHGMSETVVDRVDALCGAGAGAMCAFGIDVRDAQSAYLEADVGCRGRGEAQACATFGRLQAELARLDQRLVEAAAGSVAPETVVAQAGPRLAEAVAAARPL